MTWTIPTNIYVGGMAPQCYEVYNPVPCMRIGILGNAIGLWQAIGYADAITGPLGRPLDHDGG